MSALDTLSRVVGREAGKLLKLSEATETPLTLEQMESLETLSRCAKALRVAPTDKPDPDDASASTDGLLAAAGGKLAAGE